MSKRPCSKRKGKKKKTAIEELVDGSIQLLDMNYFISKAEHHGGDEKYSLIKQMMKALMWDPHTQTGLNTSGLVVRDCITGAPLHFAPNATRLVRNQGCNFTFYDPCIGNSQLKTKANKLSERLANNDKIIGRYKGRSVKIHQVLGLPVDNMLKSMKAHEDIMPFNDPPRY